MRLTTYHPCSAERQEIRGFNPPGTPWAISTACCGRDLYLYLLPTESCALGSTHPLKMSTRDFSWGIGGRRLNLTTYHPRSAERQENPGPNLPRNPRATLVCCGRPLNIYLMTKRRRASETLGISTIPQTIKVVIRWYIIPLPHRK